MTSSRGNAAEHSLRATRREAEEAFDRITVLAATLFAVPIALVTFIDDRMQRVKSKVGTDFSEGLKEHSFCRYIVDDPAHPILVVEDLRLDPRFANNPSVADPGYQFYAGAPLILEDGACVGTLCILDFESRPALTKTQKTHLAQLAAIVVDELELRFKHRAFEEGRRLLLLSEAVAGVGHWRYLLREDKVIWSDEVYRIHGVAPDTYNPNLTGGIDFYVADDRIKVVEALQNAIKNKSGFEFELRLRRSDGAIRTVVSRAVCELDEWNGVVAVFGVFMDVTEKSAIIADLQQARTKAETATADKAAFLANMSHEFRTPLNSIIGFSEVLTASLPFRSQSFQQAALIGAAGRNLLTLIDDVLDLAKLDSGKMRMRANPFSPLTLCENAINLMIPLAEKRGLLLRFEAPDAPVPVVIGDPDRLRQVILNLLGNAIKFTRSGSVTLKLDRTTPGATDVDLAFAVADTGIGIPTDKIGVLFDRFSQLDQDDDELFKGTGLGLAISQSIVDAMGGTMSVSSRLGQGSVFTVQLTLPLDPHVTWEDPTSGSGHSAALPALRRERRILVADDVAMNRELIRVMLAPIACPIDFVNDGESCVRQVQSGHYTLVLMDLRMPKLDGLAATRAIRAFGGRFAKMPIIALTADVLPEQIEACRAAGMVDHIEKPFAMRDINAKVRDWLNWEGN